MRNLLAAACLAAAVPAPLSAQDRTLPDPPAYAVTPATSAVLVDASLDETTWADAAPIPLSWEWLPGNNVAPPVETECRLAFDADYLYLGCLARDPDPSAIRAHLADRDTPLQDDHIVLLLDPFRDRRRGFEFRINPLGVQMDAVFSQSEGASDFSWDAIWSAAGRITEDGWVVEAAIPFRSLRFPAGAGVQTWGVSLERSWPRSSRHRMRSHPTDRSQACLLCQANDVTGFQDLKPGVDLEFAPTLTAGRTDERPAQNFPLGDIQTGDTDVEPGLTARWGVTPNVTLNAAVNPDFSQVEADVGQLDVNTRFALYFPERRPFFLEGADVFATPINAVFTRSIADPRAGLKVTGKQGGTALGVFTATDRINTLIFPGNQGSRSLTLDEDVHTVVARVRRDMGGASTVGALYTGRVGDGYSNHAFGADAWLRLFRAGALRVQVLHARTEYPPELPDQFGVPDGAFSGEAVHLDYQHATRNWYAAARFRDLDESFRADAGFVTQVDTRDGSLSLRRTFWPAPGGWFTQIGIGGGVAATYDHDGRLTRRSFGPGLGFVGRMQSRVELSPELVREFYAGEYYDLFRVGYYAAIQPTGALAATVTGRIGQDIDLTNRRKGDRAIIQGTGTLRLSRLTLRLSESFDALSREGGRVYRGLLSEVRAQYHFDVRTFLRLIVQHRQLDQVVELPTGPLSTQQSGLFTQGLFSYKVNPQTVLFLGYSDDWFGMDPCAPCTTARALPLRRVGRTFFLKLGYAWRP